MSERLLKEKRNIQTKKLRYPPISPTYTMSNPAPYIDESFINDRPDGKCLTVRKKGKRKIKEQKRKSK